jgi:hypothetical protein
MNPSVAASTEIRNPLDVNRKIIDFNKVGSFDLDFGAFFYKLLKNGSKIEHGMDLVILQAESRATRKLVTDILESGDDDSQWTLILHCTLCYESTRRISKSAGFQSKKMLDLSYHMEQLWGILEIGSSSKGCTNKDESFVTGIIVVAGSPSKNICAVMKNLMELLGMKYTRAT